MQKQTRKFEFTLFNETYYSSKFDYNSNRNRSTHFSSRLVKTEKYRPLIFYPTPRLKGLQVKKVNGTSDFTLT